jgi:predicted phage terminase large subunit-like protein
MDWIQQSTDNFKMITPPFETFIGVDLASKGDESDYFVITVVGIKDSCIYVLDGLRTKASLFRQFELIRSYDSKWSPSKIGIESAAQQKIITDQWMEMSTLPIVPIKSSAQNEKNIRIQRLSVLFETGRILLNPVLTTWVDELLIYPRGTYDDTIDSLAFAIQSSQVEGESEVDWESVKNMIKSTKSKEPIKKSTSDVRNYKVTKI